MTGKNCKKCGTFRSLSDFHKARNTKDGLKYKCKTCRNVERKELYNRNKPKRTKKQIKAQKAYKLKIKYNLTPDEHQLMYILQNGKCAICKRPTAYNEMKTDHCHKSGKVRGLLCCRCNMLLAAVDDKEFMEAAIKYIG